MKDHRSLTQDGFMEFLNKFNVPRGKLVDIGCRDSHLKTFFEGVGFEWYGCDYCSKIQGREKDPTDVIFCDMQNLNMYNDSEFDVVFACHSFEHIENPSQALREFKRILKPGGWAFISMPVYGHKYVWSDADHINVILPLQMEKLAVWTGWKEFYQWIGENEGASEQNNQYYILRR